MSDPAWCEYFGRDSSLDNTPYVPSEEEKLFDEGEEHQEAGRMDKAVECYERAYELGHKLARERFIELAKTEKRAARFDSMSADEVYAEAVTAAGKEYWLKAADLYQKATDKGHHLAPCELGKLCFGTGNTGISFDTEKSVELFLKAADYNDEAVFKWLVNEEKKGYRPVRYVLGMMYMEGKGTPQNGEKALEMFEKAVLYPTKEEGSAYQEMQSRGEAWYMLALYHSGRLEQIPNANPDRDKAAKCYEKAAWHGSDPLLKLAVGKVYLEGKDVPHDKKKAGDLFREAAYRHNEEAEQMLEMMEGGKKK